MVQVNTMVIQHDTHSYSETKMQMWIVKVKEQVWRGRSKKENPQWKLNNNKTNLVNTPLTPS